MVGDGRIYSQKTFARYGIALLAVLCAWAVRMLLSPLLGTGTPLLLFSLAVTVSAYIGGLGPGLLATLVGSVVGAIFFVADLHQLSTQIGLLLFVLVNASIVAICETLRRSRESVAASKQATDNLLKQIAESRALLDSMFDNAPIGMGVYDRQLRFVRLNDALAEINGIPKQEHIGRSVPELLPRLDPAVLDAFRRVFDKGEAVYNLEVNGYTPANPEKSRTWHASFFPVKTDGNVVYCGAVVDEITEQKESERALQDFARRLGQSNEDLRQFGYAASHDLLEPLRMVTSYTQLLERRYCDQLDEKGLMYIGFAIEGAHRIENLLRGLREYWQVSEIEVDRRVGWTDANVALDRALQHLETAILEANVKVTRDPLPVVLADEVPLVQLFQNIVSNALKYRHPDRQGHVHIRSVAKDGEWIFSVRDNGIGIDPQYAPQIFKIFKRLNGHKYAGAGMGLAICQKIVERFGGRIWVESKLGEGAMFFFTIPGADRRARPPHQLTSPAPAAGSHR